MLIKFTSREMESIKMLAQGRHFFKDIHIPNRDLERWNNSQYEADLLGVMGEYAVCKYLKIPMDMSVNLEGDGGEIDMYLGDWTIQVKSTKYKNGRLVFNHMDEVVSLLNILTVSNPKNNEVYIAGYISKKDLHKKVYEEDLGHGKRYCVNQSDLKCISELTFYYVEWAKLSC
jgi:hypothetical protein